MAAPIAIGVVDASVSKTDGRKPVPVRFRPRVQEEKQSGRKSAKGSALHSFFALFLFLEEAMIPS
jgi:hypothetical protein